MRVEMKQTYKKFKARRFTTSPSGILFLNEVKNAKPYLI